MFTVFTFTGLSLSVWARSTCKKFLLQKKHGCCALWEITFHNFQKMRKLLCLKSWLITWFVKLILSNQENTKKSKNMGYVQSKNQIFAQGIRDSDSNIYVLAHFAHTGWLQRNHRWPLLRIQKKNVWKKIRQPNFYGNAPKKLRIKKSFCLFFLRFLVAGLTGLRKIFYFCGLVLPKVQ